MKTEPTIAAKKLKMMKQSTKCLGLGLFSLIPVLGAGYVPFALWYSFSARQKEKLFWNPARPHRIIGLICAAFGGLVWGAVDTIAIYRVINPY
jgi:hypothetical protein